MRIALGQDVFASDGKKVGTVDRVVLDGASHHVEQVVVHKGVVFLTDKLIDRTLIERVDEDGVHLSIDAAEESTLADFYDGLYSVWSPDAAAGFPSPVTGWYAGSVLTTYPPVAGRGYPGTGGFFELAPVDPPQVTPESNLSEDDVWVGKGAEVVSADDEKLGHVHDVMFDAAGGLTGVVVRSGMVRKHDLPISAEWVGEVDDDHIRLTVSGTAAKKTAVKG